MLVMYYLKLLFLSIINNLFIFYNLIISIIFKIL